MTDEAATGSLQQLLDDGWAYHDSESARLAGELEAAAARDIDDALLAPFLHLATHTIGEHLGDWPRALRLGKRVLDGRDSTVESAKAWGRLHVAAVLAGASIEAAQLELACLNASGSDFVPVMLDMRFMLIGALVGAKRVAEAGSLYRAAVALAAQIDAPDFLDRAIAVASNNLGWELFETASRSPEMDELMRLCADTGLARWRKCGNWINEERALYFRAQVGNALGDHASALADADEALAVIAANGQRPLDAALLHLARAAALAASGDANGEAKAIDDADGAAAKLAAPELQAQFAAQRAAVLRAPRRTAAR